MDESNEPNLVNMGGGNVVPEIKIDSTGPRVARVRPTYLKALHRIDVHPV